MRSCLDARAEHAAGVPEAEDSPPDTPPRAVHLARRCDERSPLIRVDERGREQRVVNDVADRFATEQERLPRGNVRVETARARHPFFELHPKLLVRGRERLAVPES